MQLVIAVPVCGLLAGAAAGVLWPELPLWLLLSLLGGFASLSVHALRVRRVELLLACVGAAFAAGGVVLALDAWQRASQPSLRREFDRRIRLPDAEGRASPDIEGASVVA